MSSDGGSWSPGKATTGPSGDVKDPVLLPNGIPAGQAGADTRLTREDYRGCTPQGSGLNSPRTQW